MTNWVLVAVIATFALVLPLNTNIYAFHENLGIDGNKASELYRTNPNDPAILQWKNALQSAINSMDKCFTIDGAISCQSLIETIISNCKSHPNTLLGCNDSRLPQYPLILQKALDAQEQVQSKAYEAQEKAFEAEIQQLKKQYYLKAPEAIGSAILDRCIKNDYGTLKFEAVNAFCDGELMSLQKDCQMKSTQYYFCKDQRFVGYLKQHSIVNSTVSP